MLGVIEQDRWIKPISGCRTRCLADIERLRRPADLLRTSENVICLLNCAVLIQEPAPQRSVIIGAIQTLLEAPILEHGGRRFRLHIAETRECYRNAVVRCEWPAPVSFEI